MTAAAKPTARHWAQMGETTFVAGIWLLYGLHRIAGRRGFRLLMWPVVLVHWLTRPTLREASLDYLRRQQTTNRLWPHEPGWRQGLQHVALFAETMLDKLLAMAGRYPAGKVRLDGAEAVAQQALSGGGGVLVTAHIGCLELCRAMAQRQPAFKLNVLVHTRHAQAFNRILQRLQPGAALNLIEVSEITVATAMLLAGKLAAGEFVAIAGDRVPLHGGRTVTVDFLGSPAPLPIGPYVLASLLKCPLYFLGCLHEGDGYAMHFERLAEQVLLPRKQRETALAEHAARYAECLARLLRRSPYDWFNFYRFWDPAHA
ncbi:acyltransferase [Ideonella azotifigens]|uniref:Acyltransferase n=1 Tax=Ideonella azotifigens TaxID=513160 RepID=A0ABN1KAW0_9BURK|nr:acyltransferase [Ideonella azotifigens]MCD2338792.1 acyltransferase [Ideonella azotifigens]